MEVSTSCISTYGIFDTDLMAYCPNLDKGEIMYPIIFEEGDKFDTLQFMGHNSNQACRDTLYTPANGDVFPVRCIEPAIISAATFPMDSDANGISDSPSDPPRGKD